MTSVLVPASRLARWVENFEGRHGATSLSVFRDALVGTAADGSSFLASLPFSLAYSGQATPAAFAEACAPPADWATLLVRKGGFAVARLSGTEFVASKVGQRHVQGRTKAGGQSQQRFARRRDNQARAAFEAAADHAARLIADAPLVVVGGDGPAVEAVLADARLRGLAGRVVGEFLTVPDPRRGVLEEAVLDACAVTISVVNA
ncbi:MAG: acVLRF1 family peptidyl-tRNA hydrolase [Marmoricola sp.]